MYKERLKKYRILEGTRQSKLLVYVTGDRRGLETNIASDAVDFFVDHLDLFLSGQKISLFLYSIGGQTLAAWNLVNLVKQFCKDFEVIIPSKALSAGTLICLGADNILMTKQATLGPIDPSINTPLNPQIPGMLPSDKCKVSVEDINGFVELAKNELEIKDDVNLTKVLLKLANNIHPLVLGQAYRVRAQIQMLARKLLSQHTQDVNKIDRIVSFLCSGSGSHDYTINRKEAKDSLGLNIEKPDNYTYNIIKEIFLDIRKELKLNEDYKPNKEFEKEGKVNYNFKRALIESVGGGSDVFISEGTLEKEGIVRQPGIEEIVVKDNRKFEGWRHYDE